MKTFALRAMFALWRQQRRKFEQQRTHDLRQERSFTPPPTTYCSRPYLWAIPGFQAPKEIFGQNTYVERILRAAGGHRVVPGGESWAGECLLLLCLPLPPGHQSFPATRDGITIKSHPLLKKTENHQQPVSGHQQRWPDA